MATKLEGKSGGAQEEEGWQPEEDWWMINDIFSMTSICYPVGILEIN